MPVSSADIARFTRRTTAEKLAARHACRARDIAGHWNGAWSSGQWLALLAEWEYTCYLCGRQFPPDQLTPDHVVPLSRGGKNAIHNIRPACPSCNSAKGSKTLDEYLAYLDRRAAA